MNVIKQALRKLSLATDRIALPISKLARVHISGAYTGQLPIVMAITEFVKLKPIASEIAIKMRGEAKKSVSGSSPYPASASVIGDQPQKLMLKYSAGHLINCPQLGELCQESQSKGEFP
jgi:hypothetical protein